MITGQVTPAVHQLEEGPPDFRHGVGIFGVENHHRRAVVAQLVERPAR